MTARLVLIDDDATLLEALSIAFESAGYLTTCVADGDAALSAIRQHPPQAIVSDVNMPGIDGFTLCRMLRAEQCWVPIVLLTARDDDIDEALGLELGADDYVSKPFSTKVLLARVASLLRRERARAGTSNRPHQLAGLSLDQERLEARYRGQLLSTTVTEFRLLEVFSSRAGHVLSRAQLLAAARDGETFVADRIIDTYVARLRRKFLAISPSFERIETVIGIGYRWKDA